MHPSPAHQLDCTRLDLVLLVLRPDGRPAAQDVEELVGVRMAVPLVLGTRGKDGPEESDSGGAADLLRQQEADVHRLPALRLADGAGRDLRDVDHVVVLVLYHRLASSPR